MTQQKTSEQEWLDFLDELDKESAEKDQQEAKKKGKQSQGVSKNMLSKSDRRFLAVAVVFLALAIKLALEPWPQDLETIAGFAIATVVLALMCL